MIVGRRSHNGLELYLNAKQCGGAAWFRAREPEQGEENITQRVVSLAIEPRRVEEERRQKREWKN